MSPFPHEPPLRRVYGGPSEPLFLERRTQAKALQEQVNEIGVSMNSLQALGGSLKAFRARYDTRRGWKQWRGHVRGDLRREMKRLESDGQALCAEFVGQGKRR